MRFSGRLVRGPAGSGKYSEQDGEFHQRFVTFTALSLSSKLQS